MAQGTGWLEWPGAVVRAINRVFTVCGGALAVMILVVVLTDVFLRYVVNDPTTWGIDVASFGLSYLFFFALGPALESGFHVSVDFFQQYYSERVQRWASIVASLLAVVFAAVLFWELLDTTIDEFVENNLTPTAIPVPVKYVVIIGPIGAFQMLLTAVAMAIDAMRGIRAPLKPADAGFEA